MVKLTDLQHLSVLVTQLAVWVNMEHGLPSQVLTFLYNHFMSVIR